MIERPFDDEPTPGRPSVIAAAVLVVLVAVLGYLALRGAA